MFNYPNPFSSTAGDGTHIRYTLLSESSSGKLIILDSSGNLVYIYNLVSNELNAGTHTIFWDGLSIFNHRLSPGVYFGFLDFNGEIVKSKIAVIN
jgi:flagellar hook assembly protein FlgD